ncbi:MAG: TIGR03087 family PEP-CTERM/XrtA system glycosyltransferase [Planctomycetota bacterium]
MDARQPGRTRPRVLMLTHRVPYPPDRGDRIRAYHLLEALVTRFDVTLAAIADEPVTPATMGRLESLCQQVLLAPAKPMQRRASAAKALLTGRAITPAAMHDRLLDRQLVRLHRHQPFDTVLTYCTGMIEYAGSLLAQPDPPRHVLDLVDVDSQKWARFASESTGPMRLVYRAESRRLRAVEAGQPVPFDAVTVISDAEAERYACSVTAAHNPIVIGNGVDMQRFKPSYQPTREPVLIFTGVMSYKPNIDAAVWFARQVMPRILAAVPSARFDIVGKSPSAQVAVLDELPGVRVVGPVDNTADSLRNSAVAVAPIFIAPGVQNKVLEAMACGLPVVCSSAAARGIDGTAGEHLLVADEVGGFVAHCVRLLLNPDERARIGEAARYRVQDRYDWAAATRPMLDLLQHETPTPQS